MFNHPAGFGPTGESSYCLGGVLHTMLLHTTRRGTLEIFAGLDDWDGAFHHLRAAGGLLVSATRSDGRAKFVAVKCAPLAPLLLGGCNISLAVPDDPGWQSCEEIEHFPSIVTVGCEPGGAEAPTTWHVRLATNESAVLHVSGVAGPPFMIKAAEGNAADDNYFGYRRQYPTQKQDDINALLTKVRPWEIQQNPMFTRFAKDVSPTMDTAYPRPQLVRSPATWSSLNGLVSSTVPLFLLHLIVFPNHSRSIWCVRIVSVPVGARSPARCACARELATSSNELSSRDSRPVPTRSSIVRHPRKPVRLAWRHVGASEEWF